jgi:hypothetical protein
MSTNNNKGLIKNVDWRFFWGIVEKWGRGIFVENDEGVVLLVNEAFGKIFVPDQPLDNLYGIKSIDLIEAAGKLVKEKERFLLEIKKAMEGKERIQDQEIILTDGRLFEIDCIPVFNEGVFLGKIWEFHEGTTLREVEEKLIARNVELEKINKVMVGRELKMIELKAEIKRLREELKNSDPM